MLFPYCWCCLFKSFPALYAMWHDSVLNTYSIQGEKFTGLEIMSLWNSFKKDFPEGEINRSQMNQLVKDIFPR